MAFNINAHVILSGPKNIKSVTSDIQRQLGTIKARVDLEIPKGIDKRVTGFNKSITTLNTNLNTLRGSTASLNSQLSTLATHFDTLGKSSASISKSQSDIQRNLSKTGKEINRAGNEIEAFGKDAALAIRRFAAFTVATGVVFGFVRAVQTATKAAINYEREITKVIQVTGAGAGQIDQLNKSITQLSVSLGVDANELAELSRIFAQTGQTISQVQASIKAVARSTLAPTFGEMKNTAEGLIAAMAQFNIAASRQEEVLAGLNAVSKKFAVEAEDLVSVIRRAGGVFSQAAGQFRDPVDSLNELIGIFTAVRSTTRESADTIAVGLRTIFTRIQRRGTIEFLKQFNIELVNAQGNFIGLFPAFNELAKGLDGIIKRGDALTLSAITEELGGVRQVGKLIPAITQFNKALAATKIAGQAAAEGLGKDVALGLQPLGKQFEQLQQRFSAFVREISQSQTFQGLAKVALSLGNAFLSISETLKPLLPLLTTFAAIKISKGLFDFGTGFVGGLRKGGGAGGAGGALGSAVTGGGGGGGGGVTDPALTSAMSALTTSQNRLITATDRLMATVSTANRSLGDQGLDLEISILNLTRGMGSLVTALNTIKLGGGGFSPFGTGPQRPRKFARGGPVHGPSHAQGGVPAILEGGEYVIPKTQYHAATAPRAGKVRSASQVGRVTGTTRGTTNKTASLTFDEALEEHKQGRLNRNALTAGFGKAAVDKKLGTAQSQNVPKAKGSSSSGKKRPIAGASFNSQFGVSFIRGTPSSPFTSSIREVLKRSNVTGRNKLTSAILTKTGRSSIEEALQKDVAKRARITATHATTAVLKPDAAKIFEDEIEQAIPKIFESALAAWKGTELGVTNPAMPLNKLISKSAIGSIGGQFFEAFVRRVTNNTIKDPSKDAIFDFQKLADSPDKDALFGEGKFQLPNEFKNKVNTHNVASAMGKGLSLPDTRVTFLKASGFAAGGNVFAPRGTDTVPAMLTPGEFVINKGSAKKIGYGNLGRMNRMKDGGVVPSNGVQYLAGGTSTAADGGGGRDAMGLMMGMQAATGAVAGFTVALSSFDTDAPVTSLINLAFAVQQASLALNLLAPSLAQNLMRNNALSSAAGRLGGVFKTAQKQFKGPLKAFQRSSFVYSQHLKATGNSTLAFRKATSTAKTSLMKSFGANSLKGVLVKGMTGVPALIAALIAKPLIDGITKPFTEAIFGAVEKIEGTDIEGRKGVSRRGAGVAGGLGAAGGATAKALGAAGTVGLATGNPILAGIAAAVVATFEVAKGVIVGMAKQVEFDAFTKLNKVLEKSNDTLAAFNKLSVTNQESLEKLNSSLLDADNRMETAFQASRSRVQMEERFTLGGMVANAPNLGGIDSGVLVGAATGITAFITTMSVLMKSSNMWLKVIGGVGAAIGSVALGFGVFKSSADAAARQLGATNLAFQKATTAFTPERVKAIDDAFISTTNSMLEQASSLDFGAIESLADIDVGGPFTAAADKSRRLGESLITSENAMDRLDDALEAAGDSTSRLINEFHKMSKIKLVTNLTKNVKDEADMLGEEGSKELIDAFFKIRNSIDFDSGSIEDTFRNTIAQINNMDNVTAATRNRLREYVKAEMERQQSIKDVAATNLIAQEAASRAQRAFDALAASLDNFSAQTKQIAAQLSNFAGSMKTEFDNIFSSKVSIGKVNAVNPFENIESATRSQLSTGMEQVRSLSGDPDDPAFKGIESLVATSKEIPFAVKDTLSAVSGKGDVSSTEVMNELLKQLESRGVDTANLSPAALGALKDTLQSGLSRQGTGDVSTTEILKKLLGEGGDVEKSLVALSEDGRKAMSTAFEAATGYRNALLNIARLQQEMLEKERNFKLSMLDKEAALRDRIAKATGRETGGSAEARARLGARMRVQTQMRTGTDGKGNLITSGVGSVGDPFDVDALMDQRRQLQKKRTEARDRLGLTPGQAFDPSRVDVQDESAQRDANELGLLNEQLNGNTAALQELSNNTSVLAAIEQEIAALQKKALSAQQAAMSFDEARIAVATGEMTQEDFDKNFGNPLRAMLRASQGGTVTADEAIRIRKMQSDPTFAGFMDTAFEKETARRRDAGETVFDQSLGRERLIEESDVRREFNRNNQMGIHSVASATGVASDLTPAIREQHARSLRLEDEALAAGGDMAAVGMTQADAAIQLFQSQQDEFKQIFKTANDGLDAAVDKFQKAVDDFRRLRSIEESPEMASKREFEAAKKVKDLEDKRANLAPTATAEERKKLDHQIMDAKQEATQAKLDVDRSLEGQRDEEKRAQLDVKEAKHLEKVAQENVTQLEKDQKSQEKASAAIAAQKDPTTGDLDPALAFKGVEGRDVKMDTTDPALERYMLGKAKTISEATFGAGSTAAKASEEELKNLFYSSADDKETEKQWAVKANEAVQNRLVSVDQQAQDDPITNDKIVKATEKSATASGDVTAAEDKLHALQATHFAEMEAHNQIQDKFADAGLTHGSIYVADEDQTKEIKKIAETGEATKEQSQSLKEMAKSLGVSTTTGGRNKRRVDDQTLAKRILAATHEDAGGLIANERPTFKRARQGRRGSGGAGGAAWDPDDPAMRVVGPVLNALTTVTAGAGAGIGTAATGILKGTALVVPDAWGGEFIDAVGNNVWDSSQAAAQQMGGAAWKTVTASGELQTDLLGQQLDQQMTEGNMGGFGRGAVGWSRFIGEAAVPLGGGAAGAATRNIAKTVTKATNTVAKATNTVAKATAARVVPATSTKTGARVATKTEEIAEAMRRAEQATAGSADDAVRAMGKSDKGARHVEDSIKPSGPKPTDLDKLPFDEAVLHSDYIPHHKRAVTGGIDKPGKRPLSKKEIREIKAKQNAAVEADRLANQKAKQQLHDELRHVDDDLLRVQDRPAPTKPTKQPPKQPTKPTPDEQLLREVDAVKLEKIKGAGPGVKGAGGADDVGKKIATTAEAVEDATKGKGGIKGFLKRRYGQGVGKTAMNVGKDLSLVLIGIELLRGLFGGPNEELGHPDTFNLDDMAVDPYSGGPEVPLESFKAENFTPQPTVEPSEMGEQLEKLRKEAIEKRKLGNLPSSEGKAAHAVDRGPMTRPRRTGSALLGNIASGAAIGWDMFNTWGHLVAEDQQKKRAATDKAQADATAQQEYEDMLLAGEQKAKKTTKPFVHDPKSEKLAIDPANIGVADMAKRQRSDKLLDMRKAAAKSPDTRTRRWGESLEDGGMRTQRHRAIRRRRTPHKRQAPRAWAKRQQAQGLPSDYKAYLQDRRRKMSGRTGSSMSLDFDLPSDKAMRMLEEQNIMTGAAMGSGTGFTETQKTTALQMAHGKRGVRIDGATTIGPKDGDVSSNIGEVIATKKQEAEAATVSSGEEMGELIVLGMKNNIKGIGETIANEIKANLVGESIDINANVGPIQVQITDGGNALRTLGDGMVDTVKGAFTTVLNTIFNSDGNQKDAGVRSENPHQVLRALRPKQNKQ